MNEFIGYQKLDLQEQYYLKTICRKRWKKFLRGFLISYSLPFMAAMAIGIFLNALQWWGEHRYGSTPYYTIPKNMDEFWEFVKLNVIIWFPAFILITIANFVFFLIYIPRIYIDIIRNVKKKISFYPSPYFVPETGEYFIKTAINEFMFFKVSYESYIQINEKELLTVEIFPATRTYLDLKKADNKSIETDYSIKWP